MNWLFPGFLLGGLAIAVPILLHLLRRRPKRTVPFPSLRFLALTQPRNDRSQRIRRWLVLLMRCAALALLAAAFARPFFGGNRAAGRQATVIVIDNSFSLQTGNRWAELQRWARAEIGRPGPQDKIGLLLMAPRPHWLAPLTTGAEAALARLDQLAPGWETARAEPALRLAAETLAATPADARKIVLLGDHQRLSWAGTNFGRKLPGGIATAFPPVSPTPGRAAAVQAAKVTRTAEGFRATVSVRNFGAAHSRTIRVFRDGALLPVQQQAVALGDRATATVQFDLPAGAPAEAAAFWFAQDDDDLTADDRAYAVWQAGGERTVLLDPPPASVSADHVGAALAATSELSPSLRILPTPAAAWPGHAVAVLRNDASFAGEAVTRLDNFLRSGGAALVFMTGGPAQAAWLERTASLKLRVFRTTGAPAEVRDWAMDHPLVGALAAHSVNALLGWEFQRGWALPADALEPLALWPDSGVALGETSGSPGRTILCGFAPDRRDSEWPVREVFVPFVHRAASYLLGAQESGVAKPVLVGEAFTLPAENGRWRTLEGPQANTPAEEVRGAIAPTAPGIYEFTAGATRRLVAVNLNPEESDPAPWADGTPWLGLEGPAAAAPHVSTNTLPIAAFEAEQRASLWWWALGATALLGLGELGLANRTTR